MAFIVKNITALRVNTIVLIPCIFIFICRNQALNASVMQLVSPCQDLQGSHYSLYIIIYYSFRFTLQLFVFVYSGRYISFAFRSKFIKRRIDQILLFELSLFIRLCQFNILISFVSGCFHYNLFSSQ